MSKLCPNCGAPANSTTGKCEYCGAQLDAEQPVQTAPVQQNVYIQQPAVNNERANWPVKSKIVAGILALILGGLGIHKFYLGNTKMGIVYVLFCWTYIPAIIGFIEGIIILCSNDENFQIKYHCRIG